MSDYIYKNKADTIRVKIFQAETMFNEWNVDIFDRRSGDLDVTTFSVEFGDYFNTMRDAKEWIVSEFGEVKSMGKIETVTEGW